MDDKELSFLDKITAPLTGDYRKKKPISVKAADVAVGLTPVGSAVEIGEELSKEDPSYAKIGVIAAGDVLGAAIPPAGIALKTLTGSGRGLVRDIDDLVDTWAKGDISNKELRDSAKELGVEINTKRITKNRDSSDIEITMPDGNIYTGVNTIPDEVIDPEYVKGLTKNADTDAIKELGLSDEALEAWKAENYAKDKFRVAPIEKLEDAAKALREGQITSGEFRELSDAYQPIVPIKEMPNFPTKEEVVQALHATDKRKVQKGVIGVNKTIQDGTPISARLDIPAYNDTDTWVVSLHDGTEKGGATVGYAQTAVLNDVNFTTVPLAASSIAAGKGKTTIARMNGSYVNAEPEEVYNTAKQILEENPEDWTQVGMNPYRASYFYDKADGMPVVSSDQVIQVGPLVFAKNVKKTTPDDEMFEFTNKRTGVTANFSEGGMALEEQMAMNFGKIPDNTVGQDPVSGNDIPLGSTAENVRDDIPTNLSEGEIVVPADVVNFHGVKLFEDLRAEAKLGYAQMAQDGRIGGQPMDNDVDMDMDISLTLEDLETSDDAEPVQMDEGGLLDDDENTNLIGGEEQFNQGPYYSQKGGFDMENAYAGTGTSGPVLEMREYMNDDGHRIFITFIDGVPQMEIPEGYYPVEGEGTVVATTPPVGGSGGSDMGDPGSGTDIPMPKAVNYRELSMAELSKLVEDQKSLSSKFIKTINPLVRIAMWDQTRRTKNEIERRLTDPEVSEVDKMRLRNLLEIANRDEPGLIKTLLDKVTGSTLETAAGNIPKPKIPDVDFDDPTEAGTVAAPYTPNDQEEEPTTTPGVNEKSPAQIIQDSIDIKRIEDEMKSQPRPTKDDDDKPFVQPPYDPLPPADSGFGGMGPDPAEKFGGSQARFQPERTAPTREQQMLVQGINKGARVTKKRKKKKSK